MKPVPLLFLSIAIGCSKPSAVVAPSVAPATVLAAPDTRTPVVVLTGDAEHRIALAVTAVAEREAVLRRAFPGVACITPSRHTQLVAPFSARLEVPDGAHQVVAGGDVLRGQAVWKLVPLQPDASLQRSAASRDLASAQAAFEAALTREKRAEQLLAERAGSKRAAEDAHLAVETTSADLADAKVRIAAFNGSLLHPDGTLVLSTPIGGTVLACEVLPGQIVQAGTLLAEIAGFDPLWIQVGVHAAELSDVDLRAAARIQLLGESAGAPWYEAQVAAAPPVAHPTSGEVVLVYELPWGGQAVRPGQRVLAMVAMHGTARRRVVPHAAIVRDAYGGDWVYVRRQEHEYARQRVEVAWLEGGDALLRDGPAVGTEVVTSGATELFGAEFGQGK